MFEIVNEIYFKVLVWKKIIPIGIYYIIENGVLVAVDFPAEALQKSRTFSEWLSKWNLGENFGFIKFKIFEWKLVFPLIFADDSLKYSTRGFLELCWWYKFLWQVGGNSGGFHLHLRSQTFFFVLGKRFWKRFLRKIFLVGKGRKSEKKKVRFLRWFEGKNLVDSR